MSNTFAPNGFNQYKGNGYTPTFEQAQVSVGPSDTRPIFVGDPVSYAAQPSTAGATAGQLTGLLTQALPPVALTVAAAGIATSAAGVMTITMTGATAPANTALPANWVPPIGSQVSVTGATAASLNGLYTVASVNGDAITMQPQEGIPASTTSSASGVVTCYTPVAGIFVSCKYLSIAQKRTVWSNFWPGSDANTAANVNAYIINDRAALFEVASGNSAGVMTAPIGLGALGQGIGFAYAAGSGSSGNGNTSNELSTAYADQNTLVGQGGAPTFPQLLPFRVVELKNYTPDGSNPLQSINGNDYTSAYNRVVVAFAATNRLSVGN